MGDIAHLMPVIHPYVASAQGKTHGADFRINEPEHAYLTPAKLLAMTAIDLLYGDAEPARNIIADFKPAFTKTPTSPRTRPVQEGTLQPCDGAIGSLFPASWKRPQAREGEGLFRPRPQPVGERLNLKENFL